MERVEPIGGGFTVLVDDSCTFGTDAVLLSRFAAVRNKDRVCDLGTGSGIIPLLWYAQGITPTVDAVDCSAHAVSLASRSVVQNELSAYMFVHKQDWSALSLPHGAYDIVVCNPPYFAAGSGKVSRDPERRLARHEAPSTLSDVTSAASRLLKFGGRFCLCHRPQRQADVLAALEAADLQPTRLQTVQARADTAPFLILCEAAKGGSHTLSVLPTHFLEK